MSGGLDGVRGTAFPFRIDPGTGRVAMTEGEAKIGDNIRLVIGTRVPGLVHDPDDEVLVELATKQVVEALLRWEPRIVVTSSRVETATEPGEVRLRLDYVHANEQVAGSAILPVG